MAEEPKAADNFSSSTKRPSKAWYLLPIFFGIIGGLVMYLVIKNEDRKMAKKGIILGIILTVVGFVLGAVVGMLMALMTHPLV